MARQLVHIGHLDDATEAPELIFTPGWERIMAARQQATRQVQTGLMPEGQTGLVMTHRIDATTNVQLNAIVDKVNRILSRKTLIMVLVVAAVAFFIGKQFFGKAAKAKRKKKKNY